jgi:hypothetical protein
MRPWMVMDAKLQLPPLGEIAVPIRRYSTWIMALSIEGDVRLQVNGCYLRMSKMGRLPTGGFQRHFAISRRPCPKSISWGALADWLLPLPFQKKHIRLLM